MDEMLKKEYSTKTKLSFKVWKKVFKYLFRYKGLFILAIIAIISLTLLETIFTMYICTEGLEKFLDTGIDANFYKFIINMVLLVLALAICTFTFIQSAAILELRFYKSITKETFEKVQNQPFTFFDKVNVGWLMARIANDTSRLGEIVSWGMVDIAYAIFKLLFVFIVMATINFKLALIMLIIVPIVIVITALFNNVIVNLSRKQRRLNALVNTQLNEGIGGAKTSKTLNLEQKNLKTFSTTLKDYKDVTMKIAWTQSIFYQIIAYSAAIALALMGYYGGLFASLDNPIITASTLFLFLSYSTSFFEPVLTLARLSNNMKHAQVAAERVFALNEVKPELLDSDEVIEKYGDFINFKKENWEELKGKITFDHVSFTYSGGKKVLNDFNLEINQGQSVALVGETGAGKSTIVNLLCRFYEPTKGKILIDDKDYKERSVAWLHANLGYVLQTPLLFSGTVKENIRYGRLEATDEEVYEAARLVNAEEFILNLENGYDTEVGEGGNRLSQGQKQLVSFARAIIANPSILILDEATSSIDTQTESYIQKAIKGLMKGRTSVIVAHRLSTIVNCDLILVISDGKIIEKGTHDELMKLQGSYYKLYTNQFIEEKMQELNF